MNSSLRNVIEPTIGSWLIGAMASIGFLGVTTLQCWIYYSRSPRDSVYLKALVLLLWCLEFSRTAVCAYGGYYYAVQHWGDILSLTSKPNWSFPAMVPFTAPIGLLVQSFFARQVWSITKGSHRILFYIIVVFSIGDFAFGIALFVVAVLQKSFVRIASETLRHIATAALGCAIITDWTITGSLVHFLQKNKTERSRTFVQTCILYCVNFGLLISLTDLAMLIINNVPWTGPNLYQLGLYEVLGNFYANCMLAFLNARGVAIEHYHAHNPHPTSINEASTRFRSVEGDYRAYTSDNHASA